jgi:hypothetical protein
MNFKATLSIIKDRIRSFIAKGIKTKTDRHFQPASLTIEHDLI